MAITPGFEGTQAPQAPVKKAKVTRDTFAPAMASTMAAAYTHLGPAFTGVTKSCRVCGFR